MTYHILITGCSGGGKTTLINALSKRGHLVVPEPGLRIVQDERARDGTALPWVNMSDFLWRAVEMAKADLAQMADQTHPVFFDRGLLDAAVGLRHESDVPLSETLGMSFPYSKTVVLAPPWRDCFAQSEDRQHRFEDAVEEYDRIRFALDALQCDVVELPHVDVETRVTIVERAFALRTEDTAQPNPMCQP